MGFKEHENVLLHNSLTQPIYYFTQEKSSPYDFKRFNHYEQRLEKQSHFNEYNKFLHYTNDVEMQRSEEASSLNQTFIFYNEREIPQHERKQKISSQQYYQAEISQGQTQVERYFMDISRYANRVCNCKAARTDMSNLQQDKWYTIPFSHIKFDQNNVAVKRECQKQMQRISSSSQNTLPKCQICRDKWIREINKEFQ